MQKDLDKQLNEKDKLFDEAKASQKKTAKAISELKSEASELANQKANTELNKHASKRTRSSGCFDQKAGRSTKSI